MAEPFTQKKADLFQLLEEIIREESNFKFACCRQAHVQPVFPIKTALPITSLSSASQAVSLELQVRFRQIHQEHAALLSQCRETARQLKYLFSDETAINGRLAYFREALLRIRSEHQMIMNSGGAFNPPSGS